MLFFNVERSFENLDAGFLVAAELADTLRGNLDKIMQHGQRADAIVKNMLLHSRQGSGEHRPVDINALVEERPPKQEPANCQTL